MKWLEPDFKKKDVKRAADALGMDWLELRADLETGKLLEMTDYTWSQLRNSDSYAIKDLDELLENHKRRRKSKGYGSRFLGLLQEFLEGAVVAPIVLSTTQGTYLLNGNTRLGICKLLGVSPTVWWVVL